MRLGYQIRAGARKKGCGKREREAVTSGWKKGDSESGWSGLFAELNAGTRQIKSINLSVRLALRPSSSNNRTSLRRDRGKFAALSAAAMITMIPISISPGELSLAWLSFSQRCVSSHLECHSDLTRWFLCICLCVCINTYIYVRGLMKK